jgi:hypothetical protein
MQAVTSPRCALIVDDPKGSLGALALRLIRLGIDSYYAKNLDEGQLLAEQEAARIRVLVVAPAVGARDVKRMLARLAARDAEQPRSAVVIGACPDDATRERLREAGVGWALWEPFEESALRMVLSNALAPSFHDHERRHPRLPTTLLGRAFKGLQRRDGLVCSLSIEGAFLEMPYPYEEGTVLTLEIEVGEGSILTKAEVRYARQRGDAARPDYPAGMGVAFRELAAPMRERLERFLAEQDRRFAV